MPVDVNSTAPATSAATSSLRRVAPRDKVRDAIVALWRNRAFAYHMAIREAQGLHKGAFLGALWLVARPLVQALAYMAIVAFVFRTKPPEYPNVWAYLGYVLSGMAVWDLLGRSLQTSSRLILEKVEILKQINFPIEALPLINLIKVSLGAVVSLAIAVLLLLILGTLRPTAILLPLPLAIAAVAVVGLSWIFMFAGVVIKDMGEIVGVILGLVVFFSPVFLTPSMAGEAIWSVVLLNPLSHFVIIVRDTLTAEFHWGSWVVAALTALASLLVGAWILSKARIKINEFI